jgi:hypothetical protein
MIVRVNVSQPITGACEPGEDDHKNYNEETSYEDGNGQENQGLIVIDGGKFEWARGSVETSTRIVLHSYIMSWRFFIIWIEIVIIDS